MEQKMGNKINKNTITLGGDPEVFLVDSEGKAVSAIGKVPGSKDCPYELPSIGPGFAIQTDCCSVEFNLPPVITAKEYYSNVQRMVDYIRTIIPAGLEISLATSMEFKDSDLIHPQATLAGCSSDYNAWSLSQNEKPDFKATNVRCNGAHIHIGYEGFNDDTSIELIRALDLTLGVTSVLIDPDKERRKLYGRAGCFRMTSFGVEYRTLSPYWLASQETVDHVFRGIYKAIDIVNSDKVYTDEEQLDIQTCINICDPEMAHELIKKYQLESILPIGVLIA